MLSFNGNASSPTKKYGAMMLDPGKERAAGNCSLPVSKDLPSEQFLNTPPSETYELK